MKTIQVEVPDALAERLLPYEDRLAELLELGLSLQPDPRGEARGRTLQLFREEEGIVLPKRLRGKPTPRRHAPVPITGKPVSEIVIEDRGAL